MATVTTVVQPGDVHINAVVGNNRWVGPLTFSFTNAAGDYEPNYSPLNEPNTFVQLNATQQAVTRHILGANSFGMFSAVANLTFSENTGASDATADIRMAMTDGTTTAHAYQPFGGGPVDGDAWFNKVNYNNPVSGNYAYASFMHELGHSMGLDHGHENGMPANQDSIEYSVMTYRSYVGADPNGGYTVLDGSYPTTLMMYDIAALQYMYGANYSTQSGNTTYSWTPASGQTFINGVSQGANVANKIFVTIWDGGGIDTYDLSAYNESLYIDLSPGGYVILAQAQRAELGNGNLARANVFNALLSNGNPASLIEYANGGSAGDIFWDNAANNWFQGNGGDDQFNYWTGGFDWYYGGAGINDTVRFTMLTTTPVWVDLAYAGSTQAWRNIGGTFTAIANLLDIEHAVGTPLNDYLRGNAANNWLQGGDGNDTLAYNGGFDWLYGDGGTDNANFSLLDRPVWVDIAFAGSQQVFTRGATLDAGTWTAVANLVSIEDLVGSGFGDWLKGGVGNTWLQGGNGDDTLVYFGAFDWFYGDGGFDTGDFSLLDRPVWADLAYAGSQQAFTRGGDLFSGAWTAIANLINMEALIGSNFADDLRGNASDNWLRGGFGADILDGVGGADRYVYLNAADLSSGGTAWDRILNFQTGIDKIDVAALDANVTTGANDAFTWSGAADGGAGTAWWDGAYVGFNNGSGVTYWLQVGPVVQTDFFL